MSFPAPAPAAQPSVHEPLTPEAERTAVERLTAGRAQIETELARVIVGQREVIEQILIALFAGGHCLITGAPGLAKTLLVKSLAGIFHLRFQRIQFTPDLMPADITGTEILQDQVDLASIGFDPAFLDELLMRLNGEVDFSGFAPPKPVQVLYRFVVDGLTKEEAEKYLAQIPTGKVERYRA